MDHLNAFILFASVAAFTPGPNNLMIMASGVNFGIRASLPHYLGIGLGFLSMFYAMGFGLAIVLQAYPSIHKIIQIVGIAFLCYLAVKIASSSPQGLDQKASTPLTFSQAALFQWLNPKALTMSTFAIATYSSTASSLEMQILLMGGIFFLITLLAVAAWLFFGLALKRLLTKPVYQRIFNICMAILLLASVAPVLIPVLLT